MRKLETERLILRGLRVSDASRAYLSWLAQPRSRRYIVTAGETSNLAQLRAYIARKRRRKDTIFLAILDKASGRHIGNLKYEPVDTKSGHAMLGVLIGDPDWQGKGVATEAIRASSAALHEQLGIERVFLGLSRSNLRASRAYRKAGFRSVARTPFSYDRKKAMAMVLRLPLRGGSRT